MIEGDSRASGQYQDPNDANRRESQHPGGYARDCNQAHIGECDSSETNGGNSENSKHHRTETV